MSVYESEEAGGMKNKQPLMAILARPSLRASALFYRQLVLSLRKSIRPTSKFVKAPAADLLARPR